MGLFWFINESDNRKTKVHWINFWNTRLELELFFQIHSFWYTKSMLQLSAIRYYSVYLVHLLYTVQCFTNCTLVQSGLNGSWLGYVSYCMNHTESSLRVVQTQANYLRNQCRKETDPTCRVMERFWNWISRSESFYLGFVTSRHWFQK